MFGLCRPDIYDEWTCTGGIIDRLDDIGQALLLYPTTLFILSATLLFLQEKIFHAWAKFAKWYLPIVAVIIIIFPAQAGFLSPDRETITWLTAGVFLIASLSIIIYKSWKLR